MGSYSSVSVDNIPFMDNQTSLDRYLFVSESSVAYGTPSHKLYMYAIPSATQARQPQHRGHGLHGLLSVRS